MLTTKEQKRAADEISNSSNVIGKGTVLEGNIETFGNIRIEGRVNGNIKSKSKIALGNGSRVEGNIAAQNADIEGEVKGKADHRGQSLHQSQSKIPKHHNFPCLAVAELHLRLNQ